MQFLLASSAFTLAGIICWLIQDAAKVATYWFLRKYNIFGINDVPGIKASEMGKPSRPDCPVMTQTEMTIHRKPAHQRAG